MNWLSDRQSFFVAVLIYGISTIFSIFLLRRGFRKDSYVNYGLLAVAFLFHTGAMVQRGFTLQRCPINNLYEAVTFITWTIVSVYLLVGLNSRWRFFGAFASPILFALGVFALMPKLDPPHGPRPDFTGWPMSLHATMVLLSYGAFGLSSVAGIMYLTQERNLKWHKLQAVFSLMPPIQRLETITGGSIAAGFGLLTVGLAIGAVALELPPGATYLGDAKVLWSILVWILYLALLVMRWRFAQRGRRLACGAIGGFAFVMLTFWGVKLLSTIHAP